MGKTEITVAKWHELASAEQRKGVTIPVSFCVNGWSMEPFIRYQRDEVTIHPVTQPLRRGDIVLFAAKRLGGDYVLHQIQKIENGIVTTLGSNCLYPDMPIPLEKVLGIAREVRRGKRMISTDSWYWRAAAVLWVRLYPVRLPLLRMSHFAARCRNWLLRWLKTAKV